MTFGAVDVYVIPGIEAVFGTGAAAGGKNAGMVPKLGMN